MTGMSDVAGAPLHSTAPKKLGLGSGVGLVVANMVGVGVLTSAGYQAFDLGPWVILFAWAVGAVIATAGALAYGELARLMPRSGGEYRFLSELLHPAVGTFAGWTSLVLGFSAPIAAAAATAGPFAATLAPGLPPKAVGVALIALVTVMHAFDLRVSRRGQDALVIVKALLILGFVAIGLALGSWKSPTWMPVAHPNGPAFTLEPFMVSLVFIAYGYSGWNAAVYAAEDFREPARTVPRAMVIGTLLVAVTYLLVNWVFVANLDGQALADWTKLDASKITLGHLIVVKLLGTAAGAAMSACVLIALWSSVSAMTYVGPRVTAAMAEGGYLPRVFAGHEGTPPRLSVLLQGALAIVLLATNKFDTLIKNVGAVLTLSTALTALALVRAAVAPAWAGRRPRPIALVAAALYVASCGWILWFALRSSPQTLWWIGGVAVASGVAYVAAARNR